MTAKQQSPVLFENEGKKYLMLFWPGEGWRVLRLSLENSVALIQAEDISNAVVPMSMRGDPPAGLVADATFGIVDELGKLHAKTYEKGYTGGADRPDRPTVHPLVYKLECMIEDHASVIEASLDKLRKKFQLYYDSFPVGSTESLKTLDEVQASLDKIKSAVKEPQP